MNVDYASNGWKIQIGAAKWRVVSVVAMTVVVAVHMARQIAAILLSSVEGCAVVSCLDWVMQLVGTCRMEESEGLAYLGTEYQDMRVNMAG